MAWRRSPRSGLLLPRERRSFNPAAPLAQGLASLWVPGLGLTPDGLQNVVPDGGVLGIGGAGTVPAQDVTDFGAALRFDGVDDYLLRVGSVYQPPTTFPATLALVCRLDSIPGSTSTLYSFCSNNNAFTLELNVRAGRTRLIFTGDGNVTQTVCDIAANPTAGQVVFIAGTLDSFTSARLSLYEPGTGLFLSASSASGTTDSAAAANFLDYEVLGGWYGSGIPSSYTPVTVLDAWFWSRALADDEIEAWRRDRWSVLAAPRRRTLAAPVLLPLAVAAAQTLAGPSNAAVLTTASAVRQTLTLPAPTLATSTTQVSVARQTAQVQRPAQSATAEVIVRGLQGVPGSISLDSTAWRFDTTSITLDADAAGIPLAPPTQTAHAQAGLLGVSAAQALAAPQQAATLGVPALAGASQQVALPAQAAAVQAPNSTASSLGAGVLLPGVTQAAAAAATVGVQAAPLLARPAQAATGQTGRPAAVLTGNQTLSAPALVAVVVPFVPPVAIGPRPDDAPVVLDEPQPATGDVADMVARQAAVLPPWFGAPGQVPPVLRVPLAMAGQAGSWLYDLIGYARLQTRIRTATGGWLDLIAADFFGSRIRRRAGQADEAFRRRIMVEMFRPRATRPAMVSVLTDLTGYAPRIFEPSRPQDVGGIGVGGRMGIGVSGAVGSVGLPGEVFIDAYRDPDFGIPFAAGIGATVGGVGVPSRLVVSSMDQVAGALRDEDVIAAVEATRPVGVVAWVRVSLGERAAATPNTVSAP